MISNTIGSNKILSQLLTISDYYPFKDLIVGEKLPSQ